MEFKELIAKRRSVRKFTDREVPREVVDRILAEALSAPSARNTRTTRFLVVDDPALVARMAEMRDYGSAFLKGAPLAVLVLGVILSIAMAVTSLTRYFGTVAENVALQERVEELQPAQTVYNEYLSTAAQYDKNKYLYEYTENPNENLVEFINELEQILPSSFWTNSFSSDMEGISMSVTVEGKAAAARTILNIRNMESIEDVQISNITDTQNELGESAVTFSITGTYADIHADTEETESTGDTTGTTAQ